MDKAIIVISIDDGRRDSYVHARPLLEQYDMPATFNAAAAYVQGEAIQDLPDPAMSRDELAALAQNPQFEIAAHGNKHNNELADIRRGAALLREWLSLPEKQLIGFASPGSQMTEDGICAQQDALRAMGFAYVRTGYRIRTKQLLRVLARKAARLIHSRRLYAFAYAQTLQDCAQDMTMFAVPVLRDTKVSQLIALVEKAKRECKCCCLLFHGVAPEAEPSGNKTWVWPKDRFEALLAYLQAQRSSGQIDVMTTMQAYEAMNTERKI